MSIFLGVLIGIFCLMFLITAHEFGHFIMARRNGIRVLEFGICFPPRAIAWKKGKDGKWHKLPKSEWDKPQDSLVFSLNWLPIGGFCQMDGETDTDTRKGTFGAASFKSKTKVLLAGVAANWIIAIIIFTILAWTGMPQFIDNQFKIDPDTKINYGTTVITDVQEESPASKAGIKKGDKILKVNGEVLDTAAQVAEYNKNHAGENIIYTIEHEDANCTEDIAVTLNPADSEYLLGVSMGSTQTLAYSTWSAPIVGVGTTVQLTAETYRGLGEMLWNLVSGAAKQISFDGATREDGRKDIAKAGDSVSGPVGIVGVLFPAFAKAGLTNLAFLLALISVSLACMNILPIPALDGGRWFMMAICRLRGKKLDKETEERVVAKSLKILLILIAIITFLDILRMF